MFCIFYKALASFQPTFAIFTESLPPKQLLIGFTHLLDNFPLKVYVDQRWEQ